MKQIDAQIMGQGYRLAAPEGGEAQLLAAVARLDVAMCRIRDAGKVKARDRIAVLAALNLAFDLEQTERAAAQATPAAPRARPTRHRPRRPSRTPWSRRCWMRRSSACVGVGTQPAP